MKKTVTGNGAIQSPFLQKKLARRAKQSLAILLIPSLLLLTGCNSEYFVNMWNSIFTEAEEAYENVKTEVEEKTNAAVETYEKLNQAAEDVGEAVDAVGDAVDSIQAIGDDDETEVTEE